MGWQAEPHFLMILWGKPGCFLESTAYPAFKYGHPSLLHSSLLYFHLILAIPREDYCFKLNFLNCCADEYLS